VKKQLILRTLVFCLCLFMLFSAASPLAFAQEEESPPSMEEVSAAYLYHLERGTAVAQKNADTPVGAGSTVKIMAGLLLCEELSSRLETRIEITEELMAEVPLSPGFSLKIAVGDVFTAEQLLYTALCGSYNDAYYLLAAYTFGSVDAMLQKMNQRARDLETEHTFYRDVTGIQSGSQTTACELARIATEAYENKLYMKLCDTDAYMLKSKNISRTVYNRNALISTQGGTVTKYYDKNCYGMSAGSTPTDGNCVVTAAKHETETYLCITLGGNETEAYEYGYVVVKRLIDWVFDTYSYVEVISADKDVWRIPVTVSELVSEIPLRTHESFSAYIPKGTDVEKEITYSIRLESETLEAPVEKDTFVGYVAIVYQGKTLKTLPLYTTEEAERSSFIGTIKLMQELLGNRASLAGILFFCAALTAWIVTEVTLSRKRRRRWDKYFSDKMT